MSRNWLKSISWDILLKNQPNSRNSFTRTVAFQHLPQWAKTWGTHVRFRKYAWLLQKRHPRSFPSRYVLFFASKIFAQLDLGPAVKTNNSEHIWWRGIHMLAHLPNVIEPPSQPLGRKLASIGFHIYFVYMPIGFQVVAGLAGLELFRFSGD